MELNKNCINLLKYLKEKKDYVEIQELADIYKISNRAMRYRLDKIEKFLVKNGFDYLSREYKKGVRLVKTAKLEKFLNEFIGEYTPYKYAYSAEERFSYIVLRLLQSNIPIKISNFEDKLCVSKNTILRELDDIQTWLEKRNLKLIRKQRIGVKIDGSEIEKRNALNEILSKTVSTEDLVEYVSKKVIKSKINNLQFDTLFSDIDIDFIDNLIKRAEKQLHREFSDQSYGGLLTHLAIMIKRVKLNKEIYLPKFNSDSIKNTKEYEVAGIMMKRIEEHYNIIIPECERNYISIHLLGAKVLKTHIEGSDDFKSSDLYSIVDNITREIETIYKIDFQEERNNIINDLILHLRPSLYRIKYGSKLINPLFEEIKLKYSELFQNVKVACKYLERYLGVDIGEHEISYIVIHYAAALRKYAHKNNKKTKVLIVCGTGIGTSKMLASYIYENFEVEVVGTMASRNILENKDLKYDYIISTIEVSDLKEEDYIKISPLMTETDYNKLSKYLTAKPKKQYTNNNNDVVNRLMNIVYKYCDVKNEEQLKYEIMFQLNKDDQYLVSNKKIYDLKDFINKNNIQVNVDCVNWEEAIGRGCLPLINLGYIKEEYCTGIIENIKDLGPYMVIAPGICLAHTNLPSGVNKTCMSIINLKHSVKFYNKLNDPVKLILTFATIDKDVHLNALSQFMKIINNRKDRNVLMNTSSKDEILEILNRY